MEQKFIWEVPGGVSLEKFEDSYGLYVKYEGAELEAHEALALANAIYDDLGMGWISVKDKLPMDYLDEMVLTWNGEDYQTDMFGTFGMNDPDHFMFMNDYFEHNRFPVTHWMPLPDPPEPYSDPPAA